MDWCPPIAKRPRPASAAHRENLGEYREGHLFGAIGSDVEADRSKDARLIHGTFIAQDAQDPFRSLPRPEHAEVSRGAFEQRAKVVRVIGEVVGHYDRETLGVEYQPLAQSRRIGLDEPD
jgi:hypothetical protein